MWSGGGITRRRVKRAVRVVLVVGEEGDFHSGRGVRSVELSDAEGGGDGLSGTVVFGRKGKSVCLLRGARREGESWSKRGVVVVEGGGAGEFVSNRRAARRRGRISVGATAGVELRGWKGGSSAWS